MIRTAAQRRRKIRFQYGTMTGFFKNLLHSRVGYGVISKI